MELVRKVLYPTDFSDCAEKAFQHAVVMAKAFQSKLVLFHAVVMYQEGAHLPIASKTLEKVYVSLEQRARDSFPAVGDDIEVEKVVARGVSASDEIIGYCDQARVDLVVMGTHGRSELAQMVLGSVTDRVIRNGKSSVLTTRLDSKDVDGDKGYRKVVLAVDFSEDSREAAKWAKAIADKFAAEVHLVHVVEDTVHPAYFVTGKTSIFDLIPGIRRRSTEAMLRFAQDVGFTEDAVKTAVLEGAPSAEIAQYCRDVDADLLCVGTRGMKGLDYILLGSTAERLVRKAPCAVLVVKRPE